MTTKKINQLIDHLWKHREYLRYVEEFDYPFYGGFKSKMGNCSPEAVDAMQNIWFRFISGDYDTKKSFRISYEIELAVLGEKITVDKKKKP